MIKETFLNFFNIVLLPLFNRKNVMKYLFGQFDLTFQELEQIQNYFQNTRQRVQNESILIKQIELLKVPYFKQFSLSELDFLLTLNIEFSDLFDIIYAKGGIVKGFAVIEWDEQSGHYKKRKVLFWFNWICLGIIVYAIWNLLPNVNVWTILIFSVPLFFVIFPIAGLLLNLSRVESQLAAEKYKLLFEQA